MKKETRKYITRICGLLVCLTMGSCFNEDLSDCPPNDNVRIYFNPIDGASQTRSLWQADEIDIFIFDQQGLFFSRIKGTNVVWSPNYYLSTTLPVGTYTVVAWSNLNENYSTQPETFIEGTTTLAQAMTILYPSQPSGLIDFVPQSLYFGKHTPVAVHADQRTVVTIALTENTYRINFVVKGLPVTDHQYNFTISDTNTAYYFDNTFAPSTLATYFASCQMNAQAELISHLTILRIDRNRNPILKIEDKDNEEILFETDLVALILKLEEQGITVDFDATHDFNLEITLNQTDSGITAQVSINGWVLIDEDGTLE